MKFIKKLGEGAKVDGSTDWSKEFLASDLKAEGGSHAESWSAEFAEENQKKHVQWADEFSKQMGKAQC